MLLSQYHFTTNNFFKIIPGVFWYLIRPRNFSAALADYLMTGEEVFVQEILNNKSAGQ